MQTLYNCKYYKSNNNLNLTCLKHKKRCELINGNANCLDFNDKRCLGIDCTWYTVDYCKLEKKNESNI